jgi:carboxyl-terminal processing protease
VKLGAYIWRIWFLVLMLMGGASASPASDLIVQVEQSILRYYWNPGVLDMPTIRGRLQRGLRESCAGVPFCPAGSVHKTIRDVIRDLPDRHSSFKSPEELLAIRADQTGDPSKDDRFGLGLEVRRANIVYRLLESGPAAQAGVQVGDVILEAVRAGQVMAFRDLRLSDATPITLRLERRGERLEVTITPVAGKVSAMLEPDGRMLEPAIAYLRVPSFRAVGTAQRSARLLERLINQGANQLVLDLRFNVGGYLDEAALLLSAFVRGPVLTMRSRNTSITYTVQNGAIQYPSGLKYQTVKLERPVRFGGKVVLLVNAMTSSAAELFTLIARRMGSTTIIGERTYGLADTALVALALLDGSELRLAAVKNFHADNTPFTARVEPDRIVPDDLEALTRGSDMVLEAGLGALKAAAVRSSILPVQYELNTLRWLESC